MRRKLTESLLIFTVTLVFLCVAAVPVQAAVPQRIVSMAPAATEILFALGVGDRLVGVTQYCDYPPEAKKLPHLATLLDINLEALLTAKADLVVMSDYGVSEKPKIEALGIDVFVLQHNTMASLCSSIEEVGKICGVTERGNEIVSSIWHRVSEVKKLTSTLETPKVLISVGRDISDPQIRSVYAAGKNTFYDEILTIAGGYNVIKRSEGVNIAYPKFSPEGLLVLDPDIVIDIIGYHGSQGGVVDAAAQSFFMKQWESLPELRACKEKRIFFLTNNYALHPGPRVVRMIDDFLKFVHPELDLAKGY